MTSLILLQTNSCQRRQLCLGGLTAKLHEGSVCSARTGVRILRTSLGAIPHTLEDEFSTKVVLRAAIGFLACPECLLQIEGQAKHVVASERRAHGRGFNSRHLHHKRSSETTVHIIVGQWFFSQFLNKLELQEPYYGLSPSMQVIGSKTREFLKPLFGQCNPNDVPRINYAPMIVYEMCSVNNRKITRLLHRVVQFALSYAKIQTPHSG